MTTYSNSGRQRPEVQIATTTIPGSDAAHEIAQQKVIITNLRQILMRRIEAIARVEALCDEDDPYIHLDDLRAALVIPDSAAS